LVWLDFSLGVRVDHRLAQGSFRFKLKIHNLALTWLVLFKRCREQNAGIVALVAPRRRSGMLIELNDVDHRVATLERARSGTRGGSALIRELLLH